MKEVTLSKVFKKHWDFILKIRNENFEMFYKQKTPITKEEHYRYLQKQQSNKKFHHWIICYGNETAGYVRILDNDVGIIIDNKFQNKGIATNALKLVEKTALDLGINKLVALVKVENKNSKKLFKQNNFNLKMYWYEKYIEK